MWVLRVGSCVLQRSSLHTQTLARFLDYCPATAVRRGGKLAL